MARCAARVLSGARDGVGCYRLRGSDAGSREDKSSPSIYAPRGPGCSRKTRMARRADCWPIFAGRSAQPPLAPTSSSRWTPTRPTTLSVRDATMCFSRPARNRRPEARGSNPAGSRCVHAELGLDGRGGLRRAASGGSGRAADLLPAGRYPASSARSFFRRAAPAPFIRMGYQEESELLRRLRRAGLPRHRGRSDDACGRQAERRRHRRNARILTTLARFLILAATESATANGRRWVSWTLATLVDATGRSRTGAAGGLDSLPLDAAAPELAAGWQKAALAAAGSYAEMIRRNVGEASPLRLPAGPNALAEQGGMMAPVLCGVSRGAAARPNGHALRRRFAWTASIHALCGLQQAVERIGRAVRPGVPVMGCRPRDLRIRRFARTSGPRQRPVTVIRRSGIAAPDARTTIACRFLQWGGL